MGDTVCYLLDVLLWLWILFTIDDMLLQARYWIDTGSIPLLVWYWDYSQLCGMTLAGPWSLLSHGQGWLVMACNAQGRLTESIWAFADQWHRVGCAYKGIGSNASMAKAVADHLCIAADRVMAPDRPRLQPGCIH